VSAEERERKIGKEKSYEFLMILNVKFKIRHLEGSATMNETKRKQTEEIYRKKLYACERCTMKEKKAKRGEI